MKGREAAEQGRGQPRGAEPHASPARSRDHTLHSRRSMFSAPFHSGDSQGTRRGHFCTLHLPGRRQSQSKGEKSKQEPKGAELERRQQMLVLRLGPTARRVLPLPRHGGRPSRPRERRGSELKGGARARARTFSGRRGKRRTRHTSQKVFVYIQSLYLEKRERRGGIGD